MKKYSLWEKNSEVRDYFDPSNHLPLIQVFDLADVGKVIHNPW